MESEIKKEISSEEIESSNKLDLIEQNINKLKLSIEELQQNINKTKECHEESATKLNKNMTELGEIINTTKECHEESVTELNKNMTELGETIKKMIRKYENLQPREYAIEGSRNQINEYENNLIDDFEQLKLEKDKVNNYKTAVCILLVILLIFCLLCLILVLLAKKQ